VKGKKRPAWLDRPARRQIALSQVPKAVNPANFLENYNIWYNKSSNFDQSTPYAPLPSSSPSPSLLLPPASLLPPPCYCYCLIRELILFPLSFFLSLSLSPRVSSHTHTTSSPSVMMLQRTEEDTL